MEPILAYFHRFLLLAIFSFQALIFLRVILSWIPNAQGKIARFAWEATEPILGPLRRILPFTGPIDLSPMAAYFLLEILLYFL